MRCLRILLPTAVVLAATLLWPQRGDAQIRRCTRPDGEVVFTDRACSDVGGADRPAPAVHSPTFGGKTWARGCSRNLRSLIFEITAAIDSRDVNRLATAYDWTGMSSRNGYAVIGRLETIANRPLLDVNAVLSAPQLRVDANGMTVSSGVDTGQPGANVVRRTPVAVRVDQTLSNGTTPSRTTFGLRRRMGCWWIVL